MQFINRVSLDSIGQTPNNRITPSLDDFVHKNCARVLQRSMKNFCFDKFPYVLCKDHADDASVHAATHHSGGNCYSFAWHVRKMLRQSGIEAYIVSGMPPPYFMQPAFKAICHAAVFVPYSRDKRAWGVVMDPSVYVPPMIVAAPGHESIPTSAGKSVMRSYCDKLCASGEVVGHSGTTLVNPSNPSERSLMVKVPPGLLTASIRPGCGKTFFSFVLAEVDQFDRNVTKHVHSINRDVFRTSTDKHGRWQTSIRYKPDTDVVRLTNHVDGTETVVRGEHINSKRLTQAIVSMGPRYIDSLKFPDPSKARVAHLAAMLRKVRTLMKNSQRSIV